MVIRGEKGALDLRTWVASFPNDRFEIAAITVAKLWHGVERATGQHKAKRQSYLQTLLASLPIIPYTEQTACLLWPRCATVLRVLVLAMKV